MEQRVHFVLLAEHPGSPDCGSWCQSSPWPDLIWLYQPSHAPAFGTGTPLLKRKALLAGPGSSLSGPVFKGRTGGARGC